MVLRTRLPRAAISIPWIEYLYISRFKKWKFKWKECITLKEFNQKSKYLKLRTNDLIKILISNPDYHAFEWYYTFYLPKDTVLYLMREHFKKFILKEIGRKLKSKNPRVPKTWEI